MESYRVTVEYTVDVIDPDALRVAGEQAWLRPRGCCDVQPPSSDAPVETPPGAQPVQLSAASSISTVISHEDYPVVPGVRFTSMSIGARADWRRS